MFIALSPYSNDRKKYYNTEYIKTFEKHKLGTVVVLTYGNDIVKETPEEIMEMLKGEK